MKIDEIKTAVTELTYDELRIFASWLENHLSDKWDEQIEADAKVGRLDHLIKQAEDDFNAGRCIPLEQILGKRQIEE